MEEARQGDQAYMERLRNIRQRYGCMRSSESTPKRLEYYSSGNFNVVNPEPVRTNQHIGQKGILNATPSRMANHIDQERRQVGLFSKNERSHSMAERGEPYPYQQGQVQIEQATYKRIEGFNSFIKDLDTRIEEKEKLLMARFKQNEKVLKGNAFQEPKTSISRYSSSKQLRPNYYPPQESIRNGVQRDANDRKMIQKYTNRTDETPKKGMKQNIDNFIQKKWVVQQSPLDQKYNLSKKYKDAVPPSAVLKQNLVQYGKSPNRGPEKRDAEYFLQRRENDSWNVSKLDNIQQRIKSVLKQSN